MAGRCEEVDLEEGQSSDTSPLLMDPSGPHEHVVTIPPATDASVLTSASSSVPQLQQEGSTSASSLSRSLSARRSALPGIPSFTSSSSNASGHASSHGPSRQRTSPLNSGLWISIELFITISQVIASVIILGLSRNEHPQAPLHIWVAGYAAGCLATLPLLYLRYTHRYVRMREEDPLSPSPPTTPSVAAGSSSYVNLSPASQSEMMSQGGRQRISDISSNPEIVGMFIDRLKIALDCFFAVWFVVGNVWIFGGQSAAHDAPNLYRLCIALLTFSCIGYAMPFILCATICCCLPCIIALLGIREDQNQNRGASQEAISALPTYKFKAKSSSSSNLKSKSKKDGNDSDGEGPGEGGWVAPGTDKQRQVPAEDAVCCICLGQYTDGVELRELPCTHHFHVECVDKWLTINASCPLCKHDVGGAGETGDNTTVAESGGNARDRHEPANSGSAAAT